MICHATDMTICVEPTTGLECSACPIKMLRFALRHCGHGHGMADFAIVQSCVFLHIYITNTSTLTEIPSNQQTYKSDHGQFAKGPKLYTF